MLASTTVIIGIVGVVVIGGVGWRRGSSRAASRSSSREALG